MAIDKKCKKVCEKRTRKNFRPFAVPRYLPGSVPIAVLKEDLKMYNEHRFNVYVAKAKVDTSPPKMNPYNYLNLTKLADNARRLQRIDHENKGLVRKINLINRHGGKVDTFNAKAYDRSASKWYEHETKAEKIVVENRNIYRRIMKAQSLNTKASHEKFWKEMLYKMKFMCKYGVIIFNKRNYDAELRRHASVSPIADAHLHIDRPICYLSFKIDNGMKLGTVFIELYTDYVPVTCENFLALCKEKQSNLTYKDSIIHNVVKCKYIEMGDITLGNGKGGKTIYGDRFAEENYLLGHNRPGVVSAVPVGGKENSSMFLISLCELNKFDKNHVVFGKVVKGFHTILKINDLGKKVGKPHPFIRIIDCGECPHRLSRKIIKHSQTVL